MTLSKEKEHINKTQGEEFKAQCAECSSKTYHNVLLSLDKTEEEHDENFDFYWDAHYQIIRCQGCKTISFRQTNSNSDDFEPITHETLYPPRLEGGKGINNDIYYLPTKVRRIYKETLCALNSNSPILAGIGLRALIETICKEKNTSGKDLHKKINDLVAKKILTPAGADVLHKIRTLGNEAAHEVKPHNDKQLRVAIDIAAHLLRDVYILPKQVEAEFDND